MARPKLPIRWNKEMSAARVKPGSTRVIPDKRGAERDTESKLAAGELSPEDGCVVRQNAGLPKCGRCQTCADQFFFDQVCSEVEGDYENETKH
jgi:hypothetical protein